MADYERLRVKKRLQAFGSRYYYYRTTVKNLTRAQVIRNIHNILEHQGLITENDVEVRAKADSWLAQVERGEKLKLSTEMRDVLLTAINCTPAERLELKLLAGDSVDSMLSAFADTAPEFLLQLMLALDAIQRDIIISLQATVFTSSLKNRSEREVLCMVLEVIEMAARDVRERLERGE